MQFEQKHKNLFLEFLEEDCHNNLSELQRVSSLSRATLKKWQLSETPIVIDHLLWNKFLQETGLIYDAPNAFYIPDSQNPAPNIVKKSNTNLFDKRKKNIFLNWLKDHCGNNISAASRLSGISSSTLTKWQKEDKAFTVRKAVWKKFLSCKNKSTKEKSISAQTSAKRVEAWWYEWLFLSTSKSDSYEHLKSVYREGNNLIATDGHILSLVQFNSEELLEGIGKGYLNQSGEKLSHIETAFPNYKSIFPRREFSFNLNFQKRIVAKIKNQNELPLEEVFLDLEGLDIAKKYLPSQAIRIIYNARSKSKSKSIKLSYSPSQKALLFELICSDYSIKIVAIPTSR